MEITYNETATDFERQVQAMILLDAFEKISAKAKGLCRIVPLKGIDLLRSLYSETLDRELNDIDLLVFPAEKAKEFIELLQQDGYRPEFSFALDEAALNKKRKVSLISHLERMPNIDVHLALVTKKFFSHTINGFNQDAISRTKAVDEVISVLDDVDRWHYLATHLAFHFLDGDKWYRDLALLLERFSEEQRRTLIYRTKQYDLERVVAAVCARMQSKYPDTASLVNIEQLLPDKSGKRFLRYMRFIEAHPKRVGHGLRLARYYWEFVFISKKEQRRHSFFSLMFPSLGNLQNIYRCHKFFALLLYIPHILINSLGIFLFLAQYHIISTLYRESLHAK